VDEKHELSSRAAEAVEREARKRRRTVKDLKLPKLR